MPRLMSGLPETLKDAIARDFGTPAVVVDLDIVERNISRLQAHCRARGVANRPHTKTHKSTVLAQLQVDAGAQGITCQKLGEAEIMAEAGLNDILISYNLIGPNRAERLGQLASGVTITVAADNPVVLETYRQASLRAGRPISVVVECDTGRKRAGVETAREAIQLAAAIKAMPDLTFAGLLFYPTEPGWPAAQSFLDEATVGLRTMGLEARIISTGGTPNWPHVGQLKGATEHRSGTSIFNDRMMMKAGVATLDDCALAVVTTVVSRAGAERGILDAGSKTLTADTGGLDGYGLILEYPEARIKGFAEEHGFLDLTASNDRPAVGRIVSVIPNHVCVVVNMVDQLVTVRGSRITGTLDVSARGCLV